MTLSGLTCLCPNSTPRLGPGLMLSGLTPLCPNATPQFIIFNPLTTLKPCIEKVPVAVADQAEREKHHQIGLGYSFWTVGRD